MRPGGARRAPCREGERPTRSWGRGYEWRYLFSFVRPQTGETVSTAIMGAVLQELAGEVALGPRRRAAAVLDGAGWHRAKDPRVPEGVHLVFQPPYSPELQRAGRLWPQEPSREGWSPAGGMTSMP